MKLKTGSLLKLLKKFSLISIVTLFTSSPLWVWAQADIAGASCLVKYENQIFAPFQNKIARRIAQRTLTQGAFTEETFHGEFQNQIKKEALRSAGDYALTKIHISDTFKDVFYIWFYIKYVKSNPYGAVRDLSDKYLGEANKISEMLQTPYFEVMFQALLFNSNPFYLLGATFTNRLFHTYEKEVIWSYEVQKAQEYYRNHQEHSKIFKQFHKDVNKKLKTKVSKEGLFKTIEFLKEDNAFCSSKKIIHTFKPPFHPSNLSGNQSFYNIHKVIKSKDKDSVEVKTKLFAGILGFSKYASKSSIPSPDLQEKGVLEVIEESYFDNYERILEKTIKFINNNRALIQ